MVVVVAQANIDRCKLGKGKGLKPLTFALPVKKTLAASS